MYVMNRCSEESTGSLVAQATAGRPVVDGPETSEL
jgi:hypothetical protein